jgi:methylated-DNA-protein-cysteine methyltransferase-like protein
MLKFKDKVIQVVSAVPRGKVVSYGQVALYIGVPRAARQVGWTLNRMEDPSSGSGQVPWWRVINNQGRISIKGSKFSAVEQRELLQTEGVKVDSDFNLDIKKYRFIPSKKLLLAFKLDPTYLSMISNKLPYSSYLPH